MVPGTRYPPEILKTGETAIVLRDKISVPREALPGICNRLHQGDIQEAKKTLGVRCACYSRITGSEPLSLRISDARRRGDPAAAEEP